MNSRMAASSSRVMLGPLVAAIDQGTSSTRFLVSYNPRSRIEWFFLPNGECPLNNLVRHPVDFVNSPISFFNVTYIAVHILF